MRGLQAILGLCFHGNQGIWWEYNSNDKIYNLLSRNKSILAIISQNSSH